MTIDLNPEDIRTLLTSLEYSKLQVREAAGTPSGVRKKQLMKLDLVAKKLRKLIAK